MSSSGFFSHLSFGQSPILTFFGLAIALVLGRYYFNLLRSELKIRRLGVHAPKIPDWTPLGLGFTYKAVKKNITHKNYDFWLNTVFKNANPNRPYTTEIRVLGQRSILTADEENIKAILATQFADYGKGPMFNKHWHDFLGDSIFTTDGQAWHDSRALIRPQFIKDRVSDLRVFEEHLQVMLPQMKSKTPGGAINFSELIFRYTLDSATHFLLGASVDSLVTPQSAFADAFAEVQRVQSLIARAGPLNPIVPRKSFHASLKVIEDFIAPFIEQTLRFSPQELEEKTKVDEGFTFLHALAAFTRDRTVLRDQLLSVLLAARDTTAVTLSWLFYTLPSHPDVVRKLRQEILHRLGPERPPTYEDLKSMRYLQHTLNEILRVYPPVPFNVRVALKDTTLPHGGGPDGLQPLGIPEGTPVGYSTLVLHRRDDIYPPISEKFPDPKLFVPERWQTWTPKSWTYIPFNGGPRICVGQQFALTEMAYTVVRILQKFERVESRMEREVGEKAEIVMQPSEKVMVALFEA
ncbi:Cytochrome P450-like protein 67 [Elsinoe fawcettii]|nr:Cytochrome P450-like protein 67 [Elsinoe fawcettii]